MHIVGGGGGVSSHAQSHQEHPGLSDSPFTQRHGPTIRCGLHNFVSSLSWHGHHGENWLLGQMGDSDSSVRLSNSVISSITDSGTQPGDSLGLLQGGN